MPPPLPTESESEDLDWSDAESVHTVENVTTAEEFNETDEPRFTVEGEEPSDYDSDDWDSASPPPTTVTSDILSAPTNHASGILINKANRKATHANADADEDGPAPKTRRREPSSVNPGLADPDAIGNDAATSARYPKRSSPRATRKPATNGNLHAPFASLLSGSPTALSLWRSMFPNLTQRRNRKSHISALLSSEPAVRVPVVTHRFNDVKPQNQAAFLMQAVGEAVPEEDACEKCARYTGVLQGACVVVRDPRILCVTGGACANCWYGRMGSMCSFRLGVPKPSRKPSYRPGKKYGSVTRKREEPVPTKTEQPVAPVTRPAASAVPIHPSYAAALASGRAGALPEPAPPPVAAPAAPATSAKPAVQPGSLTPDERVASWEKRYRAMSRENLQRAHKHLAEWQEDLSTRLVAMNKVLLERLKP